MIYKHKKKLVYAKTHNFQFSLCFKTSEPASLLPCVCFCRYCAFLLTTPFAAARQALERPFLTSFSAASGSFESFFTGFFRYVYWIGVYVEKKKGEKILHKTVLQR